MREPTKDETKLPKWAQVELANLRRRNSELQRVITEGPENSNTFVNWVSGPDKPLGTDVRVRFQVTPRTEKRMDTWLEARLDHDYRGTYLYVSGSACFSVEPYSGNVVHIRSRKQ